MAERALNVRVVSPAKVVFEGAAAAVVAPAWDGQVGVLPGHAPFLTLLGIGELTVDLPGGGSQVFHVAGGVMKVEADQVTALTEYAGDEAPSELPEGVLVHPEDLAPTTPGNPLV